jgi:hypothetical protein
LALGSVAVPELWRKSLAVHDAVLVLVYWSIVVAVPVMIADSNIRLRAVGWSLLAGLIGYCAYTGIVAYRRGEKGRFTLLIVIPVALFVLGWIVVAVRVR